MKFNLIIGNPPYQKMDGGGGDTASSSPLYNEFIDKSLSLNSDNILMIIPSRWMTGGKVVLDTFRNKLIKSKIIEEIHNFVYSGDVFDDVRIAGGVQYILLNKTKEHEQTKFVTYENGNKQEVMRDLSRYRYKDKFCKEQYIIVSDNRAISIIEKAKGVGKTMLNSLVLPRMAFGLNSLFEGNTEKNDEYSIRVMRSNGRETWARTGDITSNQELIDRWKVVLSKTVQESVGSRKFNSYRVLSQPTILGPSEVCSESFLVVGITDSEQEAKSIVSYAKSKLFRFLVLTTLLSINITSRNFIFVPKIAYNHIWSEEDLHSLFKLSNEESEYIHGRIRGEED